MFDFVISDAAGRPVFRFRAAEMFNVSIEDGYTLSLSVHGASAALSGDGPKTVNLRFGQIKGEGQD